MLCVNTDQKGSVRFDLNSQAADTRIRLLNLTQFSVKATWHTKTDCHFPE